MSIGGVGCPIGCGTGCPTVPGITPPGDPALDCDNVSAVHDFALGFTIGIANTLTGGAFNTFYDPLAPIKGSVSAEQQNFQKIQEQWTQCMETCNQCITADEFALITNQLQLIAANQAVVNEQLEEEIMSLSTLVGFVLIFVVLIFVYILAS